MTLRDIRGTGAGVTEQDVGCATAVAIQVGACSADDQIVEPIRIQITRSAYAPTQRIPRGLSIENKSV